MGMGNAADVYTISSCEHGWLFDAIVDGPKMASKWPRHCIVDMRCVEKGEQLGGQFRRSTSDE